MACMDEKQFHMNDAGCPKKCLGTCFTDRTKNLKENTHPTVQFEFRAYDFEPITQLCTCLLKWVEIRHCLAT